jgi:hypothetical protein
VPVIEVSVRPSPVAAAVARARAAGGARPAPLTEGRRVRATSLLIACSHVHIAELVLGGTAPREAFDASWRLFYGFLWAALVHAGDRAAVSYAAQWPLTPPAELGRLHAVPVPEGKKWTTGCFTLAARDHAALLRRDGTGTGMLTVLADPGDADRLAWMLEMMRRYASGGGSIGECARGAADQAAGKPRQRRAPADPEWLAAEIAAALDGAWALLAASFPMFPVRRVVMGGG